MTFSHAIIAKLSLVSVGVLAIAACTAPRTPPPTVEDLMEDRVALDGILLNCNDSASHARGAVEADCAIARIAVERLAKQKEAAEAAKREQAFERNREQLRVSQDKRQAQEAATQKVDAYNLPLVPVEPPPAASSADTQAPVPGQTRQ
jgi:hypothetical protein